MICAPGPSMRPPEAIIFDFDGVLVESVDLKGQAFADLYADAGPEIQARVLAYHTTHGGVSRFEKIRLFEKEFLGRPATEDIVQEKARRFSELVEQKVIAAPWVHGAREFLERFYKQIPLSVASATPENELIRILEARRMDHYFVHIKGSPRSKADCLALIIKNEKYDATQVVMVGDALTDYDAAQANKARFVGRVPPGATSPFPADTLLVPDMNNLESALS